jgi:hypothetical protein
VRRAACATIVAALVVAAAPAARADRVAEPCHGAAAAARATRIRTLLAREARRGRRWDVGWGVGLGVVAVAQGALAYTETTPVGEPTDAKLASLWVGAIKATIGAGAHVVLPLRVTQPGAPTGDACADLAAAERALRDTARAERAAFVLNHLGGLALTVGGALYLGLGEDDWGEAALSAALGYPVGLAITYTLPRDAWHAWRDGEQRGDATVTWRLTPVRSRELTGVVVGGVF